MFPAAPLPYSADSGQRIKGHTQPRPTPEPCPTLSPAPAKKGWDGYPDTDGPGTQDHHQGMLGVEADVAKGFTDDNVALKSQESQ